MSHPEPIKAPFPYFGGKSRAAELIWEALGDVGNYVEPFAGSLAVLLARPHAPRIETCNDRDAYLSNFWRAVQAEPEAVAKWADWPVMEADLHARHFWLIGRAEFRERMLTDPDFYDTKIAGWWVWGLSAWLGSGWCDVSVAPPENSRSSTAPAESIAPAAVPQDPRNGRPPTPPPPIPSRQAPLLSAAGRGVHRPPTGGSFDDYFRAISSRLRRVRVACGDWSRVLTDSCTIHVAPVTGVLLDPPYLDGNVDYSAGGVGTNLSADVRAWAIEHGADKRFRVALCGYEGEHEMPADWQCVAWKARGGYSNTAKGGSNGNERRERIWFSPHCANARRQRDLFAAATP